ncbi:MAG: thioredoxin domain-containing protein [Kofleriaceae bacterium]
MRGRCGVRPRVRRRPGGARGGHSDAATPPPPVDVGGAGYGGAAYGGDGYGGLDEVGMLGDDGMWIGGLMGDADGYGFGSGGLGLGGVGYGGSGVGYGTIGLGSYGGIGGAAPPDPDDAALTSYLPGDIVVAKGTPDPRAVYAVPVAHSPVSGPDTARVTIVTSVEIDDPFSVRLLETLDKLTKDLGDDVRVVLKNFIVHRRTAQVAALAFCAANRQGQGYPYVRSVLSARHGRAPSSVTDVTARTLAGLRTLAQELGLEMVQWEADVRSPGCRDEVIADQRLLSSLGASAVPWSWINGRWMSGNQPIEKLRPLVDEELAKAKKAAGSSKSKRRAYYDGVVRRGKTAP